MNTPKEILDNVCKRMQEAHQKGEEYVFLVAFNGKEGYGGLMGGNTTNPIMLEVIDTTFHNAIQHIHQDNKDKIIDGADNNRKRKNK